MNLIDLCADILLAPYGLDHTDLDHPPTPLPVRSAVILKVACAWCGKTLREGAQPVSHGICEVCRAQYFPDLLH